MSPSMFPTKRFLNVHFPLNFCQLDWKLPVGRIGYITLVGPNDKKRVILKDENHPSVIIWGDHGTKEAGILAK